MRLHASSGSYGKLSVSNSPPAVCISLINLLEAWQSELTVLLPLPAARQCSVTHLLPRSFFGGCKCEPSTQYLHLSITYPEFLLHTSPQISRLSTTTSERINMKTSGLSTSKGRALFVCTIIFQLLAIGAVGLRILAKRLRRRPFELHDYLIFAALV